MTHIAIETRTGRGSGGDTVLELRATEGGVRRQPIDLFGPPDGLSLVEPSSLSARDLISQRSLFAIVVRSNGGAEDVKLIQSSRLPLDPLVQTLQDGDDVTISRSRLDQLQNEQCDDDSASPYIVLAIVAATGTALLVIAGAIAWMLVSIRARRRANGLE